MTYDSDLPVVQLTLSASTRQADEHGEETLLSSQEPSLRIEGSTVAMGGSSDNETSLLLPSKRLRWSNIGSTARDHLANERTYLAWVRTALALVGASIALLKWGVATEGYLIGIVGLTILWTSTWRYFKVMRLLQAGHYEPNVAGIWIMIVILWGAMGAAYVSSLSLQ